MDGSLNRVYTSAIIHSQITNRCSLYIVDVSHCASDPCVHGTCFEGTTGFACKCDDMYQGTLCDEGNF